MTSYNPLHPLQASLSLGSSGLQVLYPCQLCSATFRWQFDLLKHYATQHFYEELLGQLRQEPGYSAPASPALEGQMVIHYAVNQGAVKKMLEKMGAGQNTAGAHRWEHSVYKTIENNST